MNNSSNDFSFAVPVFRARLKFKIAKAEDKMDALPLLILLMLRDKRSIDDIVEVTSLDRNLIYKEIRDMIGKSYISDSLELNELALRKLSVYDLGDQLSVDDLHVYIDGLTEKLFMLDSDPRMLNREILKDLPGQVVNLPTKVQGFFFYKGTKSTVNKILENRGIQLQADDFEIITEVNSTPLYLKRKLSGLAYDTLQLGNKTESDAFQCEFRTISYKLVILFNNQEEDYFYYRNPLNGALLEGKTPKILFDDKKPHLRFSLNKNLSVIDEDELIQSGIEKLVKERKGEDLSQTELRVIINQEETGLKCLIPEENISEA